MENSLTPILRTITPWGEHCVLWEDKEKGRIYKLLVVKPFERTSLQKHQHRKEVWQILSGIGVLTDNKSLVVKLVAGATYEIVINQWHRVEALGEPLVILETWEGKDLREDDIERLHDGYGRVK